MPMIRFVIVIVSLWSILVGYRPTYGADAPSLGELRFEGPNGKMVWPADKVKDAQKRCGEGEARICLLLGIALGDNPASVIYLEKSCNGGVAEGCMGAALYRRDKGGAGGTNRRDSILLFGRACDGGEMAACGEATKAYLDGKYVPRDGRKALDYARKGCDTKHPKLCDLAGLTYLLGEAGVTKDATQAVPFFVKACDGNVGSACLRAGISYESSVGVAGDHQRAIELFERACDLGEAKACEVLGRSVLEFRDQALAGDFRNVTINIPVGRVPFGKYDDVNLAAQNDGSHQEQAIGGITVKAGDKVSFDARGVLSTNTAGFWRGTGGSYRIALYPPSPLQQSATAFIEVSGAVRWGEDRNVQGYGDFLSFSGRTNQILPIAKSEINSGALIITTGDGAKYKIYALSPFFTATIVREDGVEPAVQK